MKPPVSSPTPSITSALLQSLGQDVTTQLSELEKPKEAVNLEEKVREIQAALEKTAEIKDETKRNDAQRILEASLASVRETEQKDQDEFGTLILGLDVLMKDVGNGLESLLKNSPEEEALLVGAQARITAAEVALETAKGKTFFRQGAIDAATKELEAAVAALPVVQQNVAKMTRLRLQNGDIEHSMQVYTTMTERTMQIMTARNQKTGSQLKIVRTRLEAAQEIKKQAAQALELLDIKLDETEENLRKEEDHLGELTNGSVEYTEQEKKIVTLRADVEAVRGERNTALVVYQSKEKFVAILEGHQTGTRRIFDNQKIWLAKMQSDAEERQVTWINRLETMKAMSDLQVAGAQDKVGAEIDRADAAYMAEASSAADKQRQAMMEDQPNQMRAIAVIQQAQAKNISLIREREAKLLEDFREKYGIDPLGASFLGADRAALDQEAA